MYIQEVITQLNNSPRTNFFGVKYDHKRKYVEIYIIYKDEEDEDFIGVTYEAGYLFSSEGEEDSFSIEEVKPKIEFVDFKMIDVDLWRNGLCVEYAMYNIYPEVLQNPDEVFTQDEKIIFSNRLNELINGKNMDMYH